MRRLFILRKDILKDNPGKAIAMGNHCAEAYWTNMIRRNALPFKKCEEKSCEEPKEENDNEVSGYEIHFVLDKDIFEQYINNSFVKTVCEARNLNHLLKAAEKAKELGLEEGVQWGLIKDNCLTVLTPENEDGTTTVGIWFAPLEDDMAHRISKKYQLYK